MIGSMPMWAWTLCAAAVFAVVHVTTVWMRFFDVEPRSRWLSFFGGISVAYVFAHLLPDLAEHQRALGESFDAGLGPLSFAERHVWLLALAGLAGFYGLEQLALRNRGEVNAKTDRGERPPAAYWLHLSTFALYNALVGYLLTHREDESPAGLAFYATAMALHFCVNDFGLYEHFRKLHRRVGRWVLAATPLLGWAVGAATQISEAAVGVLFALLGGGVVLNVLKEELPAERQSRWWAFAVGTFGFAALLLLE